MRSDRVTKGKQQAPHRSLFNALGLTKEEMERPLVGIVSSYNEIVPGHMNLEMCIRDREYTEAKRLLKFLDYFVGIGSENVPTNSLLREFIGGGCFRI